MRPESSPSRRGWPPIMVHKADDFKRFPYFLFVRIDCTPTHSLIQSSKYQALFWGDFGAHLAGIVQPHAEILQLPVEIGQPHTLESCSRPLGVVRVVLGVVRLVRGVVWGVGRIVLGASALFWELFGLFWELSALFWELFASFCEVFALFWGLSGLF